MRFVDTQVTPIKRQCNGPDGKACGCATESQDQSLAPAQSERLPGKVLYGSQKGTAASFAKQLVRQAATFGVELQAVDLKDYEVEQLWKEHLVLLVLSTYENGLPPDSARSALTTDQLTHVSLMLPIISSPCQDLYQNQKFVSSIMPLLCTS